MFVTLLVALLSSLSSIRLSMAFSMRSATVAMKSNTKLASALHSDAKSQLKVALCGGGVANCVAANLLAQHGVETHVFEVGRGLGGRTATRRIDDCHFDHGARYIEKPTTQSFAELLSAWEENHWIERWQGKFAAAEFTSEGEVVSAKTVEDSRFVALPAMNALCKNLATHPLIHCHFGSKAVPRFTRLGDGKHVWRVGDVDKGEVEVDWVVTSDRTIAPAILAANKEESAVQHLQSELVDPLQRVFSPVPVLAMMILGPSAQLLRFDAVEVSRHPSIASVSRENSKPGRQGYNTKECWVIHSTEEFARSIMSEVASYPDDSEISFEERKKRVNELSERKLFPDVVKFFQRFSSLESPEEVQKALESAEAVRTHRWSAAFPHISTPLEGVLPKQRYSEAGNGACFVDRDIRFAACGDYLPSDPRLVGKIEGAAVSGLSAARAILNML